MRRLTTKFDHVVTTIQESKDLSTYSFDELMGSLLAHEDRLNRSCEKVKEKAFQVKGEFSYKGKIENSIDRDTTQEIFVDEVIVVAEVETRLVIHINTRAQFNPDTGRNSAIMKLIAG